MIKLIGLKRLILLTAVVTLNVLVGAAYLLGVGPMLNDVTMQRDGLVGQIAETRQKLATIKEDMVFLNENLPKYKALEDSGFFLAQDRFMINRTMEELRQKAGISSFAFSVADVNEIENAAAEAISYKLINSRIRVDNIVSPIDSNVYILAQEMSKVFPDFARLQTLDVTREAEVDEASLKQIAEGRTVNFVNAVVEFDWITMVPKPAENPAGADGATPQGFRGQ